MKVILVNANRVRPPLSPIGLLYLSSYLKSRGVETEILDLCPAESLPSALNRLAQGPCDLIGVSIRNIDSTQMRHPHYYLPEILDVVAQARRRCPGVPIVLGGAGFSMEPTAIMERSGADYGIVGDGERALHELVRALETGRSPAGIDGLVFRDEGAGLKANPPRTPDGEFLGSLPPQDLDAVDYRAYYDQGGSASLQTKRGCALRCAYCTYPLIEGRRYRLMDPRRVADEMERFAARGFDYFHFTDSVFNLPRSHALEVCRQIASRRLSVRWHAYMSPSGFDDELARALARAGNDGVLFGVDSGSEAMLKALGKGFRKSDIRRAAAACRAAGLEFSLSVLFGAPGESPETVRETFAALDDIKPTAAFLTQGIRVYRGTPVHRRLVAEGKLDADKPLLEPRFYFSEALPPDFNEVLRRYACGRDFAYTDATDKSPSTDAGVMALHRSGVRGPCWRLLRQLRGAAPAPAAA